MSLRVALDKNLRQLLLNEKRIELKKDLELLKKSGDGSIGNGEVGYNASVVNKQFYSYILVNKSLENPKLASLNLKTIPLPILSRIEKAHRELLYLDYLCVEQLFEADKELCKYLSPYYMYGELLRSDAIGFELLNRDNIDNLVESFKSQKYVNELLMLIQNANISSNNYNSMFPQAIHAFQTEINEAGFDNVPAFLDMRFESDHPNQADFAGKIMRGAFLGFIVVNQLANINQFIYQHVLDDNMIVINENNTIDFKGEASNALGKTLKIEVQPDIRDFLSSPGDIINVDISFPEGAKQPSKDALIWSTTKSFTKEYGNVVSYKLRILDDFLNPYTSATEHMYNS